jgi:group I intron endonuclease
MIIYKTTNLINNKIYIGKYLGNWEGYLGSGVNLRKAIKKYGKENFKRETLEKCISKKQLNEREKYWILHYSSINKNIGYNLARGGEGGIGWFAGKKHSEETKKKIGKISKARGVSEKCRLKSKERNFWLGRKHTEETKEKIRQANLGKKHTEGAKKNMSLSRKGKKGKPHSEAAKDKMRQAKREGFVPWCKGLTKETDKRLEASGKKVSIAKRGSIPWNLGIPHSEETRKKIGIKSKEMWDRRRKNGKNTDK